MQPVRAQIRQEGTTRAKCGSRGQAVLPSMHGSLLRKLFSPLAAAKGNGDHCVQVRRHCPIETCTPSPGRAFSTRHQ
jgi:hypothetical protein